MKNNTYIACKCPNERCKITYDLAKESLKAKRRNEKDVRCPSCGTKVGTVS